MKCPFCRSEMRSEKRSYEYDEGGLVVVLEDVEVLTCDQCDEGGGAIIENVAELHRAIAECIIRQPGALTGPMVRFLRTFLGWSGRDLATKLGKSAETVSRWERGHLSISANADALLRWFVVSEAQIDDYAAYDAVNLRNQPARTTGPRLKRSGQHWATAAC